MGGARSLACPEVVYVGGFGRSGSTLLERVLGAVPGWVNVGELVDLPRSVFPQRELCGCGERFTDCPFWTAVGERAFGGWSAQTLARLADLRTRVARQRQVPALLGLARGVRTRSAFADEVREYQHGYGRIYGAVAEVSGCPVVVDASKGPAHGLALGLSLADAHEPGDSLSSGYSLSMVNLVRDPRGVAYSWSRRQAVRPQAGATATGATRQQMWSIGTPRSAAQWAALQAEMDLVGTVGGITRHRLRYEDLVADPGTAVTDLARALSLPLPVDGLGHVERHAVTLGPSHGLSGNPSRFRHGRIELRPDEEWREALPTRERRLVTAATFPWLVGYGYPTSVGGRTVPPTPRAATPAEAS